MTITHGKCDKCLAETKVLELFFHPSRDTGKHRLCYVCLDDAVDEFNYYMPIQSRNERCES